MTSSLSPTPEQILTELQNLEVQSRETASVQVPAFLSGLPSFDFLHLQGGARSWAQRDALEHHQRMQDLLTGLHGIGQPWCNLWLYRDHRLDLLSGMPQQYSGCTAALASALQGHFSGVQIARDHQPGSPSKFMQSPPLAQHVGVLTGVPSFKPDQLERLLEGLRAMPFWGMMTLANPVSRVQQASWLKFHLDDASRWQTASKGQDALVRAGLRTETVDRLTQRLLELIEAQLQRHESGRALGMWEVRTLYFARDPLTFFQLGGLLTSLFSGETSRPEPLRARPIKWTSSGDGDSGNTVLTSAELATLTSLPRQEVFGFRQQHIVPFDLERRPASNTALSLGHICDGEQPTPQTYRLEPGELSKHALVVGLTGSGKTTTIQHLLEQLWTGAERIPFLVIESAKAEYRRMGGYSENGKRVEGRIPQLQIYTLGDERYSPFRLNPFEFEFVDAERHTSVATHIDHLRAVFGAAFVLYAPMPYVLERCLNEIYQDAGWDLATGVNGRIPADASSEDLKQWPLFPTLSGLYRKIDEVVTKLGYSGETEDNVRAGLQARILSLMQGSKGRMLDCARGVTMSSLLNRPTVLELDALGNDQEKALIIGLLVSRLNAYRRLFHPTSSPRQLRHVTVIEEAHRLLKNVSPHASSEGSDTAGHTVEQLCAMLSEVRAYGEGIIIAEQIPSKLAPDAVKNSSLKIVHRITAQDDRMLLAGAMHLSDAQSKSLIALSPGRAVVSSEGEDHPFLVQIEAAPPSKPLLDSHLPRPSLPFPVWFSQPFPGVPAAGKRLASLEHSLLGDDHYAQLWQQVWLGLLTEVADARLEGSLHTLSQGVRLWLTHHGQTLTAAERENCVHRVRWASLRLSLEELARQRGMGFDRLQASLETVHPLSNQLEESSGRDRMRKALQKLLKPPLLPHPACVNCSVPCLLEELAEPLSRVISREDLMGAAIDHQQHKALLDSIDGLSGLVKLESALWSTYPQLLWEKRAFFQLKTCALSLTLARSRIPPNEQRTLAVYLLPASERKKI